MSNIKCHLFKCKNLVYYYLTLRKETFLLKFSNCILFDMSVFSDVPCRNLSFCKNIVWRSENCLKSGEADEYFSRADEIFRQKL